MLRSNSRAYDMTTRHAECGGLSCIRLHTQLQSAGFCNRGFCILFCVFIFVDSIITFFWIRNHFAGLSRFFAVFDPPVPMFTNI